MTNWSSRVQVDSRHWSRRKISMNPTIMRAMWYMGLVKEHAEGTKRMRDSMAGMHLSPPIFQQTVTGIGFSAVRVILRNNIEQRKVWVDADVATILGDA